MRIVDMTLYRGRNLGSLDEVDESGRYVVVFESRREYRRNRRWFEARAKLPTSKVNSPIPEEAVDWERGPLSLMIYHGAIEYAKFEPAAARAEKTDGQRTPILPAAIEGGPDPRIVRAS